MPKRSRNKDQTLGIGAVARLTGLTEHTIRVWERRYDAVLAQRSESGRRLYTAADVEKLNLLKSLTDRGVAIGSIASETSRALRQRIDRMAELRSGPAPAAISVAVLGDYLPAQIQGSAKELTPLEPVLLETSAERFRADIEHHPVDALIVEVPVLTASSGKELRALMRLARTKRAVCVYGFARSADVTTLSNSGILALRSPVSVDELRAAASQAFTAELRARPRAAPKPAADSDWFVDKPVPARLLRREQIAALATTSSTIDCECPQHLAQLVADLSAFEMYSAHCANRDDKDVMLHRYLHRTTAEARALIEQALVRVAEAEGLSY